MANPYEKYRQSPAPAKGMILRDPYKAADEGRKDEDQDFERRRLGFEERRLGFQESSEARAASEAERGRGEKRFSNISKLRDDFKALPEIKSYNVAVQQLDQALRTGDGPQGDLALTYAFAKAMDPDSVVRDAEQSMQTNSQPWFQAAVENVKKQFGMNGAGVFTPAARAALRDQVISSVASRRQLYQNSRDYYSDLSKRYGFDPYEVVGRDVGNSFTERFKEYGGKAPLAIGGQVIPTQSGQRGAGTTDPSAPFSTPEDKRVAAVLAAARRGGASFEDLSALHESLGRGPLGPEYKRYIEAGGQQDFPAATSGIPGMISQALGAVGQTAPGAYAIGASDALLGGGLDELLGASGGDAAAAQLGKETAVKENPIASLLGTGTGGALALMGVNRGLGAIPRIGEGLATGWGGIAGDALYGGAFGAGSNNDDRLSGAAAGAFGGAAGNVVGRGVASAVGQTVRGVTSPVIQALRESGVPLTFGQTVGQSGTVGRALKGIEDKMESFPFVGDMIRNRRQEGYDAFNRAAFDEALTPIGGKVSGIGSDAIEQAQNAVSDSYDNALSGVIMEQTPQFSERVANALALGDRIPNMGEQVRYSVAQALNNIAEDGVLTGRGYQAATSALRRDAKSLGRSDPIRGHDAGDALGVVLSAFDDLAADQAPTVAQALARSNQAYGNVSVLEDAVLKGLNSGGTFTPAQLGMAARENTKRFAGKKAAARGEMPFANLQAAAQEVLPSQTPNTGTTDRAVAMGLPLTALLSPVAVVEGLANSKIGRDALETLLLSRPEAARAIGDQIYDNRAIGGAIGAPLGIALSQER